jgi:hypothetical protein
MLKPEVQTTSVGNVEISGEEFPLGEVVYSEKVIQMMDQESYMDAEYLLTDHARYGANKIGTLDASTWDFERRCFEGEVEYASGFSTPVGMLWIVTSHDFSKTVVCHISELA